MPKGTLNRFLSALAAVVFLALALAIYCPAPDFERWLRVSVVLSRSEALIFCGAFGFIALFSSYFGIPWHHRTFGIGFGFLVFLSVDMFGTTIVTMHGPINKEILSMISMLAFTMATCTWLLYFASSTSIRVGPTWEQLSEVQNALQCVRTSITYIGRQLAPEKR